MEKIPQKVVILAAGLGSRLKSDKGSPKPLRKVAGKPLIFHVLQRFAKIGVKKAIVVTGHRGNEIKNNILHSSPPLDVLFETNPDWKKQNGLSILAARKSVGKDNFFLSMSDHIFEPSLIETLARARPPERGIVLAVDKKLDTIFDMDDATKVLTSGGKILKIGKELKKFDCVDTGLFLCTPYLMDILADVMQHREDKDCSLSDGISKLAKEGEALVQDIGDGLWQDVDTLESANYAEKIFG